MPVMLAILTWEAMWTELYLEPPSSGHLKNCSFRFFFSPGCRCLDFTHGRDYLPASVG